MIKPGIYELNLPNETISFVLEQAKLILNDDKNFPGKNRNGNTFKEINQEIRSVVSDIMNNLPDNDDLEWEFEVFLSKKPVPEHNDRNYYPEFDKQCQRGFIMPLEWVGKHPSTLTYNQWYDEKVVLGRNGEFFKLENRSMIEDDNIKFNVKDCELIDNFVWEQNTCIIFDSSQIHSSSNFIQDENSYKLSINGLGYTAGKIQYSPYSTRQE